MKHAIDVQSRAEGDAIKRSVSEPVIKAAMIVTGALLELDSLTDRLRVLRFVEQAITPTAEPTPFRVHDASSGD